MNINLGRLNISRRVTNHRKMFRFRKVKTLWRTNYFLPLGITVGWHSKETWLGA